MLPLSKSPIIYITRDIERALGLGLDTPGYFIISNSTPFAKGVAKGHYNVLLVNEKGLLDTWELLQNPKVKQFIDKQNNPSILIFKNTLQIEKTCREFGWKLLNPSAELSNKVEEKISQIKYLGALKKYLPDYKITKCKNIIWNCKPCKHCQPCQPFVLQFNRSHTGSGTILIANEKQLKKIQNKFPEREARIAEYIPGPLFTNNNVVTKNKILLGNISYQITGLKPFTDNPFSTHGNDWALPHKYLSKKQIAQYQKIATDVGKKLQKDGWRGLFGIDVVVDERTNKLYLLEINCRQPASTTYESQLQMSVIPSPTQGEGSLSSTLKKGIKNNTIFKPKEKGSLTSFGITNQLTTFEAHLLALLGTDLKKYNLIEIKDGAQIISHITNHTSRITTKKITALNKANFNTISYNNTEPNSDLLRIQSRTGIMERHNKFNKIGKKIIKIIK